MAKAPKKNENNGEITILQVEEGRIEICVLGTSPFIYNAMSEKATHELLMPSPKKNTAERAVTLKHRPYDEFVNSMYKTLAVDAPTRLNFPASAFKRGIAAAALDIPGANKSQIGRLVWAEGDRIDFYGVPQILCSIVRQADMNRTPDVRTRAILPEWACRISVRFMKPLLKEQTVVNLLAAAGYIQGVGDWRQQKGAGSYGQFKLVSADDPNFRRIIKNGGRVVQDAAIQNPKTYDDETEKLLSWFNEEYTRRQGKDAKQGVMIPLDSAA